MHILYIYLYIVYSVPVIIIRWEEAELLLVNEIIKVI
jgi:hypothetical protein